MWNGSYGNHYTDRNPDFTDIEYTTSFKSKIMQSFLFDTPRDSRILEIGCNRGNNIGLLLSMGFSDITGIDVNSKAIGLAQSKYPEFNFINTSIQDYEPDEFDLVFTTGVLIHMSPYELLPIVNKMKRISDNIFGMEYYNESFKRIKYPVECWCGPYDKLFDTTRMEIHKMKEDTNAPYHVYYMA